MAWMKLPHTSQVSTFSYLSESIHWHFHPRSVPEDPASYERVACWTVRCHQKPGVDHWHCQVGSIGASLERWMLGRAEENHDLRGSRSEPQESPPNDRRGIYAATFFFAELYVLIFFVGTPKKLNILSIPQCWTPPEFFWVGSRWKTWLMVRCVRLILFA